MSTIPPTHTIIAKGNSVASNHYWTLRDSDVLDDVQTDRNGPFLILPDTSTLKAIRKVIFLSLVSPSKQKIQQFFLTSKIVFFPCVNYAMMHVPPF